MTFWYDGGAGISGGSARDGARDHRLHVLRGGVDVAVEIELQRDARAALELLELMDVTPAIVENCFSSGVATAAAMVSGLAPGQRRAHLNRREVDVRQVAHRQRAVRHRAEDEDGQHDAASSSTGRLMKSFGEIHGAASAAAGVLTLMRRPASSRSWPSVTTVSPGFSALLSMTDSLPLVRATVDRPQLHRLVGFDHEDVLALLPRLHRHRRHDDGLGSVVELQDDVDELARPESPIAVAETCP